MSKAERDQILLFFIFRDSPVNRTDRLPLRSSHPLLPPLCSAGQGIFLPPQTASVCTPPQEPTYISAIFQPRVRKEYDVSSFAP